MQAKARNKAIKKAESAVPPKIATFRRALRLYETTLVTLGAADLPAEPDFEEYVRFTHIFAALLEVKEKRAKCFSKKSNYELLRSQPRP